MTELFGVILGAALAYLFGGAQERKREKHRRASFSTALLSELRTLEYSLYHIYHDEEIGLMGGRLPSHLFRDLGENVLLFTPATVNLLLQFEGLLGRVDRLWDACNQLDPNQVTDRHHWKMRAAAGYALELLTPVKAGLLIEGGVTPSEPPVKRVSFPNLPPAPEPAFKWEIMRIDRPDESDPPAA